MKLKKKTQKIKISNREKPTLRNIWSYFQGKYRYFFYYGGFLSQKFPTLAWLRKKMIRKHIKEQIRYRIEWMDAECYNNGSCKLCGCMTTALQMADKSCKKPCYPPMMNKDEWRRFMAYHVILMGGEVWIKEGNNSEPPKILQGKTKTIINNVSGNK